MNFIRRARIALLTVFAGAALAAALPGTASAGLLVASAPSCDHSDISQPFQQWYDDSSYFLVPGGNFEGSLDGWGATGGSRTTAGNEPWQANGDAGSRSLLIPAGGSVTSPAVCVGLEHPTLRFFAKRSSSGLLSGVSTLTVSALVETSLGAVVEVPFGTVVGGTSWQPTPAYFMIANLPPLLPGNYTPVAFRFRAVGLSNWQIDDAFVDPRMK
ncbi:MAG: hypothetical protein QOE08_1530 [Thermoleophilaceae bacterium]|nr:hypothetical protein [Thermoleophilaceae bacterium]